MNSDEGRDQRGVSEHAARAPAAISLKKTFAEQQESDDDTKSNLSMQSFASARNYYEKTNDAQRICSYIS